MSNLEGKDGLERDIAKLKLLYGPWKRKMAPHWKRWKKSPLPHDTTNLCTESSRADPYVNGHIMSVYLHASLLLIAVLLIVLGLLLLPEQGAGDGQLVGAGAELVDEHGHGQPGADNAPGRADSPE